CWCECGAWPVSAGACEIVFGGGVPGDGEPLDQPTQAIDLTPPFVVLCDQDVRPVLWLHWNRGNWQLHHVERQAERFDVFLMPAQFVEAPVGRAARRID